MSFRKFVFLSAVAVCGFAGPARAQVGVYGTVSGQRFGSVTCPSFAAPCASNGGVVKPYGGNFGVYYDFKTYGPVRIGLDLSGDVLTANKRADSSAGGRGTVRQYTTLIGLRGSLVTHYKWLHPYAEVAGGYSRNNTAGQYTFASTTFAGTTTTAVSFNPAFNSNYGVIKGIVGVDVAIFPFLDLRVIELGAGDALGSAQYIQTIGTNGSVSYTSGPSSHGMESIGAGIVLHLPR